MLPTLDAVVRFDREHPGRQSDELTTQRNALIDAEQKKVKVYNDGVPEIPGYAEKCINALSEPD